MENYIAGTFLKLSFSYLKAVYSDELCDFSLIVLLPENIFISTDV